MKIVLAIVTLIGLSAVAGAIVVGQMSRDAVVVEQPYETGLKFDEMRHEREEIGWRLNMRDEALVKGNNTVVFTVLESDGNPMELAEGDLMVWASRPAGSTPDVRAKVASLGGPLMAASMVLPQIGLWDINVNVSRDGKSLTLTRRIHAEGRAD